MAHPKVRAAGKDRVLNVRHDAPDIRDRYYEPALIPLARELDHSNPGTVLGAYYRLRANLNDYHAALNETGAIYVSAKVHNGWNNPQKKGGDKHAIINQSTEMIGGHAFAIVGYNEFGFIVQNSLGNN